MSKGRRKKAPKPTVKLTEPTEEQKVLLLLRAQLFLKSLKGDQPLLVEDTKYGTECYVAFERVVESTIIVRRYGAQLHLQFQNGEFFDGPNGRFRLKWRFDDATRRR